MILKLISDETYSKLKDVYLDALNSNKKIDLYNNRFFQGLDNFFNKQIYSLKETQNTYKVINDWTRLGIINDNRENPNMWRKFSFVDLVWIKIISYLRSINYPLNKIKEIKDLYYNDSTFLAKDEVEGIEKTGLYTIRSIKYPETQFYLFGAVLDLGRDELEDINVFITPNKYEKGYILDEKKEEYRYIDFDSEGLSFTGNAVEQKLSIINSNFAISINLSHLIKEIFDDTEDTFETLNDEFYNEINIEELNKFDEVKIKFKDSKPVMLEMVEKIDTKKKIGELLKQGNFQDLEIKQEAGKVVYINKTTKKKL